MQQTQQDATEMRNFGQQAIDVLPSDPVIEAYADLQDAVVRDIVQAFAVPSHLRGRHRGHLVFEGNPGVADDWFRNMVTETEACAVGGDRKSS